MTDAEKLQGFYRLLNPVRMQLVYNGMGGEEISDAAVLFHFMGGGGSDMTTVGDFRKVMGDEREALKDQ